MFWAISIVKDSNFEIKSGWYWLVCQCRRAEVNFPIHWQNQEKWRQTWKPKLMTMKFYWLLDKLRDGRLMKRRVLKGLQSEFLFKLTVFILQNTSSKLVTRSLDSKANLGCCILNLKWWNCLHEGGSFMSWLFTTAFWWIELSTYH